MRTLRSVVLACVCFMMVIFSGCLEDKIEYRTTAVPVNQNDRILISNVTWTWDKDKSDLTVTGKVKNNGTIPIENCIIFMKAYDNSGSLISNRETSVTPFALPANTQVDWKITDTNCPKPDSISVGYSYRAEISVPALKGIF